MSHFPERKEKNCLNCGTQVQGRYCQNCGQQNVEPKETIWHLISHFVGDIFHFDGKFFSTLKYLLFHPGFLTEEYFKGRRMRYLDPIRMYLFISAVFFLILISFFSPNPVVIKKSEARKETKGKGRFDISNLAKQTADKIDSSIEADTTPIVLANGDTITRDLFYTYSPPSVQAYDSLQSLLPETERDGPFNRYMSRKTISALNAYSGNEKEGVHLFREKFGHSLPYVFFVSLPLIAILLRLLYVRRKQFNYVSHAVFTLHLFCFLFIIYFFLLLARKVPVLNTWMALGLLIVSVIYVLKAMHRFYKQGWGKTIIKYLLFFVFGMGTIALIGIIFAMKSLLSIG